MTTKKSGLTQTNYRSAVDGQYATRKEAEQHPREHVKETGPKLPPPKKGR